MFDLSCTCPDYWAGLLYWGGSPFGSSLKVDSHRPKDTGMETIGNWHRHSATLQASNSTTVSFSPQGRFSLEGLRAAGPEAASLVAAMLAQASGARPPMAAVLAHPAWWPPAQKLAFLVDLSNAMEFQDRAVRTMASFQCLRGLDEERAKQSCSKDGL
jgi:hypothetical protein